MRRSSKKASKATIDRREVIKATFTGWKNGFVIEQRAQALVSAMLSTKVNWEEFKEPEERVRQELKRAGFTSGWIDAIPIE